jgi:micrococcal nuclease
VETHWQIEEVLDGDSIIICNRFTQMKKEIRLYGLDAPEVKLNRKMIEDEEKSSLPAPYYFNLVCNPCTSFCRLHRLKRL